MKNRKTRNNPRHNLRTLDARTLDARTLDARTLTTVAGAWDIQHWVDIGCPNDVIALPDDNDGILKS